MTTIQQIRANRQNALKSTGPRTAEGKRTASQNAVKHGLLAERMVIRGESVEAWGAFREQVVAELAPQTSMELLLAERVAACAWRLCRAERYEAEILEQRYRKEELDRQRDAFLYEGEPELSMADAVLTCFAGGVSSKAHSTRPCTSSSASRRPETAGPSLGRSWWTWTSPARRPARDGRRTERTEVRPRMTQRGLRPQPIAAFRFQIADSQNPRVPRRNRRIVVRIASSSQNQWAATMGLVPVER
jgi:hypothetical protein